MNSLLKAIDIQFDANNNVLISRKKLLQLILQAQEFLIISESDSLPSSGYILIDRNGKDFYPFSENEIEEWENDGSCEKGDKLYKIELLKEY